MIPCSDISKQRTCSSNNSIRFWLLIVSLSHILFRDMSNHVWHKRGHVIVDYPLNPVEVSGIPSTEMFFRLMPCQPANHQRRNTYVSLFDRVPVQGKCSPLVIELENYSIAAILCVTHNRFHCVGFGQVIVVQ